MGFFIKKEKRFFKKDRGFSLIETLIAIFVLIFVITGPLTLVYQSLSLIKVAKSRVVASYLAQDAIEYTRNKRDENILSNEPDWLSGMRDCVSPDGSNKCVVDTVGINPTDFEECIGECENLKYEESTGLYHHHDGEVTDFKRVISIKESISGKEAQVKVEVSWGSGMFERTIVSKDILLNWF